MAVQGVGFNTKGLHYIRLPGSRRNTKVGSVWFNLLQRCYSESFQKDNPSYIGCKVCDDWLDFQVFAEWYTQQYKEEGWQIDKDILGGGLKEYNPEVCRLVPPDINKLLVVQKGTKHKLPLGVVHNKNKFSASIRKKGKRVHLGTYGSQEEAHRIYLEEKQHHVREVAEDYRSKLDPDIYLRLSQYTTH